MKNTRVVNIILILMLILNAAFVGSWWYSHARMHKNAHQNRPHFTNHESKAAGYMAKTLGLSDEQQIKLDTLRKEHFRKVEMLEMAVARNEKNMMSLLAANTVDSAKAKIYIDSIGIMKADIQKELFAHFNSIKKMCNPEQSTKFDALIDQMSKEFPRHFDNSHGINTAHHDSM
jgi:Spy/CpxP family protein refolding chaperone